MAKKTKRHKQKNALISKRLQKFVLPIFLVIGAGVVVLTVLSIIMVPKTNSDSRYGVGADGFRAFVEEKGDLGAGTITDKARVVAALGNKAKSVGDAEVAKVFNFNNDRSQTVTYPFTRADGAKASLYIDMKLYQNTQTLQKDNIYVATASAGTIGGHPAYYKHAQTIDNMREYHLMVVNGLRAYRFVIAQPAKNVTISEVGALAVLKKLALNTRF